MSGTLPKGWVETSLDNICRIETGKWDSNHAEGNGKYRFYTCAYDFLYCNTKRFSGDCIILPGNGANVGEVFFYSGDFDAYQRTYILSKLSIDAKYSYFHLLYQWKEINKDRQFGSATNFIRIGNFLEYKISFPPLNEQKRIVAKLDQIMPRIDAVKERLDKVPSIIKRFRQSVLTAAVTGKLTESTEEYPVVQFYNLLKSIRGGTTAVPFNEITEFPVLRSSSVRQGHIDFQDVKYLKKEQSANIDNFLTNGDLLFTRLNGTAEYVGNCALVSGIQVNKYQYPDRLYCATVNDKIFPAYCVIAFSVPGVREEIESRAKSSAGHKRISISDIKEMKITLPPLEEQKEIVRQVDRLFALADTLESHYLKAKARVDKLSQSVLAKAFRGELVITEAELAEKEGRDFESAEKLLERILEEKGKMAGSRKKSSVGKKRE